MTQNPVLKVLSNSLKDENIQVRKSAVKALLKIGTDEAIKSLEKVKYDENQEIRELITISLKRLEIDHKNEVPLWKEEFANLDAANEKQKEFYKYWVSELEKKNYIDLEDNLSYIFSYLYSVIYDFIENEDIEFLSERFDIIMEGYGNYSSVKSYLKDWKADAYLFLGNYKDSLSLRKEIGFSTYNLETYGILKEDSLITGEVLVNFRSNGLTDFGKKNKKEIAKVLDIYLNDFKKLYGKNIVRHFLEDYNLNNLSQTDMNNLKKFFEYEEEFQKLTQYYTPNDRDPYSFFNVTYFDLQNFSRKDLLRLKKNLKEDIYLKVINNSQGPFQNENVNANKRVIDKNIFNGVPKILRIPSKEIPYVIVKTLETELKRIIRESENIYREEKELPKVGEGWISESELYYKVKEAFPEEKVLHHGRPSWLGLQHLDIYFPEKNIAIEYQGLQHDQPVEFFGGYEAFKKNQDRDKRKKLLCEKNYCNLIYVYPEYNFEEVKEELKKLL